MRISDWSSDVCSSDLLLRTSLICITLRSNRFGGGKHGRLCLQCHPGKGCPRRSSFGGFVSVLGICACRPPSHVRAILSLRARDIRVGSSEERRVGKECGSTCRSRWSQDN